MFLIGEIEVIVFQNGKVRYRNGKESSSASLAAASAAKTLCSLHPDAESTSAPHVPISEVPQVISCKLLLHQTDISFCILIKVHKNVPPYWENIPSC